MTPDKSKKPLPSSTSTIFPEQPTSLQQWKVALRRIKVLYLGGHWKQCTARCDHLLRDEKVSLNPIHATYIHFYSALSSEALARHTHELSPSKIHTLNEAKVSYQAAAATLPIADDESLPSSSDYDHESAFTNSSSASEKSAILDYYKSSSNNPYRMAYATSLSPTNSNETIRRQRRPRPLALEFRKSISFTDARTGELLTLDQWPAPPDTPPFTPPPRSTSLQATTASASTLTSNSEWLLSRAYERYNEHLLSFSDMLAKHIQTVDSLIRATRETQAMRNEAGRMSSYGDDEEARVAELKARISRLKEKGWRRERFVPAKYQDLCDAALGDL